MPKKPSKTKQTSQNGTGGWRNWWTLAGLVALLTLWYTSCRDEQAKIPRLSVDVGWQPAYVGAGSGIIPPRQDNVVTVPIAVYNNSEVPALNLELNLLLSDGSGRDIDLNQELQKDGQGTNRLGRLDKVRPWRLSLAPSVNPNREQYKSGAFNCKAQAQLTWEDVRGGTYRQVTLIQLKYAKPVETYPERFFWERVAAYSSYGGRTERVLLKNRWGLLPVQF
jgi:hypothetical protein